MVAHDLCVFSGAVVRLCPDYLLPKLRDCQHLRNAPHAVQRLLADLWLVLLFAVRNNAACAAVRAHRAVLSPTVDTFSCVLRVLCCRLCACLCDDSLASASGV